MDCEFKYNDSILSLACQEKEDTVTAEIDGKTYHVDKRVLSRNSLSLIIDGQSIVAYCATDRNHIHVGFGGKTFCFQINTQESCESILSCGTDPAEKQLKIRSPMPGNALKINVSNGDTVEEGQCLAIVEAMKMETELFAAMKARVKKIYIEEGQQVCADALLIELEPITK